MRKEEFLEICKRIPEKDHPKIQLILVTGMQLNIESVARYEASYVVFRGREGGQTDEGRGFFVPYEQIVAIKLERLVKLSELKALYGESMVAGATLGGRNGSPIGATPLPPSITTPSPLGGPADPAEIAKQNLLARIRAARTAAGVGAS